MGGKWVVRATEDQITVSEEQSAGRKKTAEERLAEVERILEHGQTVAGSEKLREVGRLVEAARKQTDAKVAQLLADAKRQLAASQASNQDLIEKLRRALGKDAEN